MTKPTFSLPVPQAGQTSKEALDGEVNRVVSRLWPLAEGGASDVLDEINQARSDAALAAQDAQNAASSVGNPLPRDGSLAMQGDLQMGGNKITGLDDGSEPTDAVTRAQLDALADDVAGIDEAAQERINTIRPEAFGAVSGIVLHPDTRDIYDAITQTHSVRAEYLWLLERTVRRFIRALIWDKVSYSIGAGGLVTWSQTGMTSIEVKGYDYIRIGYQMEVDGTLTRGATVSASALDAALAIDAAANTSAIQGWIEHLSETGRVGVMKPEDYPINGTLRAREGITVRGQMHRTRLHMVAGVGYLRPVLQTGDLDQPARRMDIRGIICDGNFFQRPDPGPNEEGPASGSLRGSSFVCAYTFDSYFEVEGWDAWKHCVDITGATHGRSGTPYTYPPREQISRNIQGKFWCEGGGDDLFTTHHCEDVDIDFVFAVFSTAGFVNNSNGIEIDDASQRTTIRRMVTGFCYSGLEIKGHSDSVAASDITITSAFAFSCTNGAVIRHIGHGNTAESEPQSPSAEGVRIGEFVYDDPLEWRPEGISRTGFRVYGYKGVHADSFECKQKTALSAYFGTDPTTSDGVVQIFWSGRDISFGKILIDGFADSIAALRVTTTSAGVVTFDTLTTRNGPLRGISHTGGATLLGGNAYLHRATATTGSWSVRGDTAGTTRIANLAHSGFELPPNNMARATYETL